MLLALRQCWVLFIGVLLIMLGNGLQGVLVGTRSELIGFSSTTIGFVMSGYFVGMTIGSVLSPKLINSVGHVRVFGAFASLASVSILAFPVFENAWLWFAMRLLFGFSFAGLYIVSESWLNDRSSNETRGQVLGLYMVIGLCGWSLGMQMLKLSDPGSFELFTLVSILISVAVIPVLMTATPMPSFEAPDRMKISSLYKITPLGFVVISLVGLANGLSNAMGAPYMLQIGFDLGDAANFMAAFSFGGLLLTWPLGRISDKIDRRIVIAAAGLIVILASAAGFYFGQMGMIGPLLIANGIAGSMAFPLYSLCLAHTNDFLKPNQMVAASSALLLANGAGSAVGAWGAGGAMEFGGPHAYFIGLGGIHALIFLYALWRMTQRRLTGVRKNFIGVFGGRHSVAAMSMVMAEADDEARIKGVKTRRRRRKTIEANELAAQQELAQKEAEQEKAINDNAQKG